MDRSRITEVVAYDTAVHLPKLQVMPEVMRQADIQPNFKYGDGEAFGLVVKD